MKKMFDVSNKDTIDSELPFDVTMEEVSPADAVNNSVASRKKKKYIKDVLNKTPVDLDNHHYFN